MNSDITMHAIPALPDIAPGDDLAGILLDGLARARIALADGDILAVAQKVVSKAAGRYVRLSEVAPSARAKALAADLRKDPRKIEVILGESRRVIRAARHPHRAQGVLITEHRLGFVCANAAVDESNIDRPDSVLLLPENPDAEARALRTAIRTAAGADVGVIVTDTFGRPWRLGLVNVAIGVAGLPALTDLTGMPDAFGRPLTATVPALADEAAAAAGLLMGKQNRTPAVVFKGVAFNATSSASAQDLLRPAAEDLFI